MKLDDVANSFNAFIDNCNKIDIENTNCTFTWDNRRGGIHQDASRLYRFLTSKALFLSRFPLNASIIPSFGSGHWLISMYTN